MLNSRAFEYVPVADGVAQRMPRTSGVRGMLHAAATQYGVRLHAGEAYDWLMSLQGSLLIERTFDDQQAGPESIVDNINGAPPDTDNFQAELFAYTAGMPIEDRATLATTICRLHYLISSQRQATTADEFLGIRTSEAAIFADFFTLRIGTGTDQSGRQAFNAWMHTWSHTGYSVDTLLDCRRDYREHNSAVKPTPRAIATYGSVAVSEIKRAVSVTPPPLLKVAVRTGINYSLLNKTPQH